jgi:hypothetical protein
MLWGGLRAKGIRHRDRLFAHRHSS